MILLPSINYLQIISKRLMTLKRHVLLMATYLNRLKQKRFVIFIFVLLLLDKTKRYTFNYHKVVVYGKNVSRFKLVSLWLVMSSTTAIDLINFFFHHVKKSRIKLVKINKMTNWFGFAGEIFGTFFSFPF